MDMDFLSMDDNDYSQIIFFIRQFQTRNNGENSSPTGRDSPTSQTVVPLNHSLVILREWLIEIS